MHKIRRYIEKDRDEVIELWKTCQLIRPWNDPLKDIDRKKSLGKDLFVVLAHKQNIIGTVMGGYDGHRGVMNYLAVHPDYRGRGFGKQLVKFVEEKLTLLGCPKINLLVRTDNKLVSNFYKRMDYNQQSDVFVFGKRLISDE